MEIMIKEENNNNMQHKCNNIILHLPIPLTLKCIHAAEIYDLWKAARAAKAERFKVFLNFSQALHRLHNTIWVPYIIVCESLMKQRGLQL